MSKSKGVAGAGFVRIVVISCIALATVGAQAAKKDDILLARVAKLERALDNRGLLDLLAQVERLQGEVKGLRGQIEEQAYTIDQLRKTQRETYVDIDQRLQGVERGGLVISDNPNSIGAPPLMEIDPGTDAPIAGTAAENTLQMEADATPNNELAATTTDSAAASIANEQNAAISRASIAPHGAIADNEASENAYREAFGLIKTGQYDESITAFEAFLTEYPNSKYADNAQYWLGETYYVKHDYAAALVEYQQMIKQFPESKKQSHAMLKIGYSYHELGQLDQARAVLEDLRNRYAGTTAARLAEERISILAKSAP